MPNSKLSKRLLDIADALPLKRGMRVLEIGCGTGLLAREIARRIGDGFVLGIDRSAKAIAFSINNGKKEIDAGLLDFEQAAIESFQLKTGEPRFDLAVAIRVGALDGRHPELERSALASISRCLKKTGKLFIDGGNPLLEKKWK